MITHNIFNDIFVIPILNLLVLFHKILLMVGLPGAFGFSIVLLTVWVRVLLHPFFKQQMDTARRMQEMKPQLDKLTAKYKKDPKKLKEEQMKLYTTAGINPAAGCIFLIIQIPIFIGLYSTLSLFFQNGGLQKTITSINSVLYHPYIKISSIDTHFLGFDLALSPQKAGIGPYLLIPVVTAFLQYMQVAVSTPPPPAKSTVKNDEKKSDTGADFQRAMNTQMKYIFPVMIGYFSYTLPVGLALYWNIFSLFSIMQYRRMKS